MKSDYLFYLTHECVRCRNTYGFYLSSVGRSSGLLLENWPSVRKRIHVKRSMLNSLHASRILIPRPVVGKTKWFPPVYTETISSWIIPLVSRVTLGNDYSRIMNVICLSRDDIQAV